MSTDKPPPVGAFLLSPLNIPSQPTVEASNNTPSDIHIENSDAIPSNQSQDSSVLKEISTSRINSNLSDYNFADHTSNSLSEGQLNSDRTTNVIGLSTADNPQRDESAEESGPSKASVLMTRLVISGPPSCRYNLSRNKATVLPVKLLQGVTELVKKQKMSFPESDNTDGCFTDTNSQSRNSQMEESGIDDDNASRVTNESMDTDAALSKHDSPGLFGNDKKRITDRTAGEELETTSAGDQATYNPVIGMDIDDIDHEDEVDAKETDVVYDISPLFTGELEHRRKRELKKSKKKVWHQSKRKRKLSHSETEEGVEHSEKSRKPVPNYFVAIQISDPRIHAALRKVQEDVVSVNKDLSSALIKLSTLHLTVMVLSLNSEEDIIRSRSALDKAMEKLKKTYSDTPLSIDIYGLGNFKNEVVFAKVRSEDKVLQLQQIAETVEECFLEEEMVSPDDKGFKPHATIMKLSRAKGLRKKGIKKIDEILYKDHLNSEFGTEMVDTLQLCAMLKHKDKSGYYQVEHSVQFAKSIVVTNDVNDNSMQTSDEDTTRGNSILPDHDNTKSIDNDSCTAGEIKTLTDEVLCIELNTTCKDSKNEEAVNNKSEALGEQLECTDFSKDNKETVKELIGDMISDIEMKQIDENEGKDNGNKQIQADTSCVVSDTNMT